MATKLTALRALLKESNIDLIIVGSEDAHQSEYVCNRDLRRGFISDFTGSAGTAVISATEALLWTDGRYFLQAEMQLSCDWKLMKSGEKGVPDIFDWILNTLQEGQVVAVDAWLYSAAQAKSLEKLLQTKKISLIALKENPVDLIWNNHNRPPIPSNPVETVPLQRTGKSHNDKIFNLRETLKSNGAYSVVVAMLDEVAWLLNIRGSDVDFNPVAISYVIVTLDNVYWFVNSSKVSQEVRDHLGNSVEIHEYEQVEDYLKEVATKGKVWIDMNKTNWRLFQAAGNDVLEKSSPITLPKSLKTPEELNGFRNAHIRDGVALTAFIHWLENHVKANPNTFTEYQSTLTIEDFRRKMDLHVGPSFTTIAGYGGNAAIIHYSPSEENSSPIGVESTFLLDSGAQYKDGTTDVTRTMHFGEPSQRIKDCYTAVLKGHIAMATLVMPEGTLGSRFDCFARAALWKLGLDYNHGTGHGVGIYLNVHEGPQGVGFRKRLDEEVSFPPYFPPYFSNIFFFVGIPSWYDHFE
jgi:Xaa-Pro aminopeptidase